MTLMVMTSKREEKVAYTEIKIKIIALMICINQKFIDYNTLEICGDIWSYEWRQYWKAKSGYSVKKQLFTINY